YRTSHEIRAAREGILASSSRRLQDVWPTNQNASVKSADVIGVENDEKKSAIEITIAASKKSRTIGRSSEGRNPPVTAHSTRNAAPITSRFSPTVSRSPTSFPVRNAVRETGLASRV